MHFWEIHLHDNGRYTAIGARKSTGLDKQSNHEVVFGRLAFFSAGLTSVCRGNA